MTRSAIIVFTAATAVLFSFKNKQPHATNYNLDAKSSTLEWSGEKVTGKKHTGTIMLSSGVLTDNHGSWTGMFEIDMNTISNTDLKAGEGKEKLEGHLKSADFFDVANHPKAKFVVSSITPLAAATENATHNVKGHLTIKDKSNPISFDAKIVSEGSKMTCTGTAVFDRSKYDIRFGSKSFFNDLGDKAINDEISLRFNVVMTGN